MRSIAGYGGHVIVRCALQFLALTFVRPRELRRAQWKEIDLSTGLWRIPENKMKMRRPHIVPLSRQAKAILTELHPLTGRAEWIFPGCYDFSKPMSKNALLAGLRRMGYTSTETTAHGFRSMASTCLHEQGWPSDAIERQLAHAPANQVKAAYNHAQHLPERQRMMQSWADYLDGLKAGGRVIAIGEVNHG